MLHKRKVITLVLLWSLVTILIYIKTTLMTKSKAIGLHFDISNLQYPLNPQNECSEQDLYLLVYIHSAPENFDRRDIIRSTWGRVKEHNGTKVQLMFIMGTTSNLTHMQEIQTESSKKKDILMVDFVDSYRNLSYKALSALRYVGDHCQHVPFILKTDDDTFVNMFLLINHLQGLHLDSPGYLYCEKLQYWPIQNLNGTLRYLCVPSSPGYEV